MKTFFTVLISTLIFISIESLQAQTNANAGFTSPPQYQPFLKQVADDVSADQVEYYTRSLADFENRHTLSDTTSDTKGIGAARRWIKEEFEKISEDKLYVKPGTIFVSSDAIFLCFKGQLIPITLIECDEDGIFVRYNSFKWGLCPICGYPLVWGVCVNPDCPSKR